MTINALLAPLLIFALPQKPVRIPVGGQAVIEGVLMKGPAYWGLAVREPTGKINVQTWRGSTWLKSRFWKTPVIRGFATMVEMMRIGMRALSISADISLGEDDKISPLETVMSIVVALIAVVGIFLALPMFISEFLTERFALSHFARNVSEGVIRGVIFVGYVAAISLWRDIRRVFEYHGAEHKTINTYESGAPLTPERASLSSRIHRRCGTSFLLIVVVVSIMVFSIVGGGSVLWRIGSRVVLLPIVIGLSYEFIRAASNSDTWGKYCIMPALTLQFVTTRNPSLDQLEVAIAALNAALNPDSVKKVTVAGGAEDGTDR